MFDPTKPAQTRDGRPATIIATGVTANIPGLHAIRLEDQPILARIDEDGGSSSLKFYSADGSYDPEQQGGTDFDLVNIDRVDRFFTIYVRETECAPEINEWSATSHMRGHIDDERVPLAVTFENGRAVSVRLDVR